MKIFFMILVCSAVALDKKQLRGLKKLLKNLGKGIYPTCRLVLFSEQVDFDTAENNCKNFTLGTATAQHGNLATVNDAEKNADLKLLLQIAYPREEVQNKWGPDAWVWAGLRKVRNNKGLRGSKKYHSEDWQWVDGSNPSEFHRWFNRRQPDQAVQKKGEEDCEETKCYQNQMRINHDGNWDDTYKYKKHPYVCDYQGKYIISDNRKSWEDAKRQCEEAGLHLAMVRNQEEFDEIIAAAEYFLGPREEGNRAFDPSNWFWVGARDDEVENTWVWDYTGKPVDPAWVKKMNWRRPNPDNAEFVGDEGQDAMAFSRWGEVDDSFNNKRRKRPFACQCPGS